MRISRPIVERLIHAVILLVLVGFSLALLKNNGYLRSYLEGFIQDKFEARKQGKENPEDYGIVLCAFNDAGSSIPIQLPALLDTILAHSPRAVGIDFTMEAYDPERQAHLLSVIKDNKKVVVGYDLINEINKTMPRSKVYPFGQDYDVFPNIGYFNFGAKGTEARYLEPYRKYKGPDPKYKGKRRTAFWARLWEVAEGIPSGKLKSHRRFINYSFEFSSLPAMVPLRQVMTPDEYDLQFRDKIVIIGNESMDDMMPTPVDYNRRYAMPGVHVVAYATATIGSNESKSNWFDRNRGWMVAFLCVLFTILFTAMHFSRRWIWPKVQEYSNLAQLGAALSLFLIAEFLLPPMGDEWWTYFAVLALFVLFAPVAGDLSKMIFGRIWKR